MGRNREEGRCVDRGAECATNYQMMDLDGSSNLHCETKEAWYGDVIYFRCKVPILRVFWVLGAVPVQSWR
jgi:hypothetical protein